MGFDSFGLRVMNKISINFSFVLLIACSLIGEICYFQSTDYKIKIISLGPCKGQYRMDPDSKFVNIYVGTKRFNRRENNMFVNGTVLRAIGPVSLSVRTYDIQDGKSYKVHEIKNLTCNSTLLKLLKTMTQFAFTEECFIQKATYDPVVMSVDIFRPFMMSTWRYGRYMWQFDFTTKKGTLSCFEGIADVLKPSKKS